MKNSIKRIICAIFAFAILVCAMSACGSSNAGEGDDTANAGSGTESKTSKNQSIDGDDASISINQVSVQSNDPYFNFDPYATITESMKGQTVRYATWINHWETEGKVPLSNFYKDTGLNVELFTVAQGSYVEKIMTSIASGDIPDAFKTNEGKDNFPLTIQLAAPIDVVSTVDLNEPIWHKSMLETGTIDGHVYLVNTIGSPWSGSNLVYYNKSLFEDNGFKTPSEYYEEGNWTWTTMLKVMKDIKALGTDFHGGYIDVEVLGDSAGASFCMYDYKTATFSSGVAKKELMQTYQWYADAREQGLTTGSFANFKDGKCGIVITGVYGLKNTGHFKDMNWNDIGFTYLPALEDGTQGKISSIYRMYGIIDGAPNANAAGYFLRYWLDPNNYDIYDTFISNKAANFYFELTNSEASDKYFNFDDACCVLVNNTSSSVFNGGAKAASSAQVNSKLQAVSNVVDEAVSKANLLIEDLKDRNK